MHLPLRKVHYSTLLPIIFFLLGSTFATGKETLTLNGIGIYSHMQKNYYWVAHFNQGSCTDIKTCEAASAPSRFTLKVITPRWTAQSYNLVWQRELASNNRSLPSDLSMKTVIEFTQLAKTQLTRGDTIDITFDGTETVVIINGAHAMQVSGKSLFNYIAKVWLGPVPPSRAFRSNMLKGHDGEHDLTLLKEFQALQPAPERQMLLAEWQALSIERDATASDSSNNQPAAKEIVAKEQPKKQTAALTKPKAAKVTQSALAAPPPSAVKVVVPKVVAANDTEANVIKQPKQKPSKHNKAVVQRSKPNKKEALSLFEWRYFSQIHQRVIYPSWARELEQDGSVSITFTMNSQRQVTSIDAIEPTYAGLLADALISAIESTPVPAPLWPEKLALPLQLTYTHRFILSAETPTPVLAPELKRFMDSPQAQQAFSTPQDLEKHLSEFVEYPYWAKSLGLKGKVSSRITLDSAGNVIHVELTKKSRHGDLNQALLAAIKKAAPFPVSLPAEQQEMSFTYSHYYRP